MVRGLGEGSGRKLTLLGSISLGKPFLPTELSGVRRFSGHSLNYTTLLLEDERGVLYVGARGAVFALNASNVADGSHRMVSWCPPFPSSLQTFGVGFHAVMVLLPVQIHWEASPEKQLDCLQKGKNNKVRPSPGSEGPVVSPGTNVHPVHHRPSASTTCGFCRG